MASSLGLRFLVTWWLGSKRDRDREKELYFFLLSFRSCRASLLFYSSVSGRHKFSQIQEERNIDQTENVNYIGVKSVGVDIHIGVGIF